MKTTQILKIFNVFFYLLILYTYFTERHHVLHTLW